MGGTLIELWHLMETPLEEQKKFEFVTRLLSLSVDEVLDKGCLSMGLIEQVADRIFVKKKNFTLPLLVLNNWL